MKVLVFGLGSIGSRHVRLLLRHFPHELFAFRSGIGKPGNAFEIPEVNSWQQAQSLKPDIALIANPIALHIPTAIACAKLGMHLFIEKPLGDSLDGLKELQALCSQNRRTCYVAYCMRFHPVIEELKLRLVGSRVLHVRAVVSSYLPHWRSDQRAAQSYSARKELGGGVLLDLSHEFDYLAYLLGKIEITHGWFGRQSDVTVDAEDTADILLTANSKIPINLHMNFMSRLEQRQVVADVAGGYLLGDFREHRVESAEGDRREVKAFSSDRDAPYRKQWEYFFAHLGDPNIMNSLTEASRLLETVLTFKRTV